MADDMRGQAATNPAEIPTVEWWDVLKRVKSEVSDDHGCTGRIADA